MSDVRSVLTEAQRDEIRDKVAAAINPNHPEMVPHIAEAAIAAHLEALTAAGVVVTQLPKPPADCHVCHYQAGTTPEFYVLCPECGCKRCPKATNHLHACTGSNDSGQRGSSYGYPCGEACCAAYDAYAAARAVEMRAELDRIRADRAAVLSEGER